MPSVPYSRACAVAGCSAQVHLRGRCQAHGTTADQLRGLGSDRVHTDLYQSAEWRRVRRRMLAESPLCQCADCCASSILRATEVVHHREPHGGDRVKFFDRANLVAMAKACHDRFTGSARTMPAPGPLGLGKLWNRPQAPNRLAVSRDRRHLLNTGGLR